jgi:hypothetical protein
MSTLKWSFCIDNSLPRSQSLQSLNPCRWAVQFPSDVVTMKSSMPDMYVTRCRAWMGSWFCPRVKWQTTVSRRLQPALPEKWKFVRSENTWIFWPNKLAWSNEKITVLAWTLTGFDLHQCDYRRVGTLRSAFISVPEADAVWRWDAWMPWELSQHNLSPCCKVHTKGRR